MFDDNLILRIHEAGHEPEAWNGILSSISDNFLGATLYLSQENNQKFGEGDSWHHNFDERVLQFLPENSEWNEDCWRPDKNIIIRSVITSPTGVAMDRRKYIPDADFNKYTETTSYLGAQGLFHYVHCVCDRDEESLSGFWIGRASNKPRFDADDRKQLQQLSLHVGSALRANKRLAKLRKKKNDLENSLDLLTQGVLHLDQSFRVLYANKFAQSALEARDGVQLLGSRLSFRNSETVKVAEALFRKLECGLISDGEFFALRSSDRLPLVVSVFRTIGNESGQSPNLFYSLFLSDPLEQEVDSLSHSFAQFYQLSAEELRTAVLVGRGCGVDEIARLKNVSPNSIKTQKKAIYMKTQTRSQSEFITLVNSLKSNVRSISN